jgi:hypothetical protein
VKKKIEMILNWIDIYKLVLQMPDVPKDGREIWWQGQINGIWTAPENEDQAMKLEWEILEGRIDDGE